MMLKYGKYKDSGIVWLGDIPEHWGASRLKDYSTKIQTGTTPKTSVLRYWENEDYNWFTPSDFTSSLTLVDSDRKINAIAIQENAARLFYKDSVLIIGIASVGKVGILAADSSANQQINSITFDRRVIPLFGAYFLKIYEDEIVKFANYSIVPIFNQTETGCLKFAVPPIPEQTAIVNYLDQKTAKLDKLIKNKEDQIARLNEIRQIEINTAVTKGLNPNVKMKNSGIDWLGDIPDHWIVNRVKNISIIVNGSTPKSTVDEYWDGEIFWVTPADFDKLNGYIEDTDRKITEAGYRSCGTEMVPEGSTILTTRAPIGNAAITKKEICTNQGCKALVPKKIESILLYYSIVNAVDELISLGQGTTFLELSKNNLGAVKIPVPPDKEQTEIANYLNQKTEKIDKLISNIEGQIAKLKEIRKIEIYNAVTGKIKVV